MPRYSNERKQAILSKLSPPHNMSVAEIARTEGISQEKLAELAGIDRSYMGNIERGEKNVTLKKVYEICDALEIDINKLIS